MNVITSLELLFIDNHDVARNTIDHVIKEIGGEARLTSFRDLAEVVYKHRNEFMTFEPEVFRIIKEELR